MNCRLEVAAGTLDSADPGRYHRLHRDGKRLIRDWFDRAKEGRDSSPAESFEPFIFLWIAFNAWAACVTGEDGDSAWRDALIADRGVGGTLDRLLTDEYSQARTEAARFRELWPIFRVEELRRLGVDHCDHRGLARHERAAVLQAAGARQFEPRCWYAHAEDAPSDWAHTLSALYRVRCNLFHGEKARSSENDQRVVQAAYATLLALLDDSRYLG